MQLTPSNLCDLCAASACGQRPRREQHSFDPRQTDQQKLCIQLGPTWRLGCEIPVEEPRDGIPFGTWLTQTISQDVHRDGRHGQDSVVYRHRFFRYWRHALQTPDLERYCFVFGDEGRQQQGAATCVLCLSARKLRQLQIFCLVVWENTGAETVPEQTQRHFVQRPI